MKNHCYTLLAKQKLNVVFIESASAGYLAYCFSQSEFSGEILYGGLVCYDLGVKESILKIDKKLIDCYTAESMQVTEQMAIRGKKLFKADIVVACTGLLKKGGSETKDKPIGTFFYSIHYLDKIHNFDICLNGSKKQKLKSLHISVTKRIIKIIT